MTKKDVTKKYFKYLLKDVMDLCQREGLHQVDLPSPAAVRITEEEYRAQKRGQENLDKLNAEIRAAQMIPSSVRPKSIAYPAGAPVYALTALSSTSES